jgi:hypothetical protein
MIETKNLLMEVMFFLYKFKIFQWILINIDSLRYVSGLHLGYGSICNRDKNCVF